MVEHIRYTLIRSMRKSIGIQVSCGEVLVRVPLRTDRQVVERFIAENARWIEKQLSKDAAVREKAAAEGLLSAQDIAELSKKAKQALPDRVAYYAKIIGVSYGRITIRTQRTKWGSCSSKGNLNFNCLLMLAPPEVIDSVIVHELCHRKEMNHSARFYAEVYRAFPEYDKSRKWLRTNGEILMRRAACCSHDPL